MLIQLRFNNPYVSDLDGLLQARKPGNTVHTKDRSKTAHATPKKLDAPDLPFSLKNRHATGKTGH